MTLKMIVAADRGNAIGWSDGRLPWALKSDMRRFKELTSGHDIVMGRMTYLSLGLPNGLPNRRNVVLTKQPYSEVRGQFGDVEIISSFDWIRAHQACLGCQPPDLWIIGGAKVYAEALEKQIVDEIYFTQVEANSGADVTLPFDLYAWKLFVLRRQKLGEYWVVDSIETPTPHPDEPRISYIKLRKTK